MSLLDKASKLAKSEKAQGLLHKVEEKAKDPELRAKVQGLVETAKEKTEVVVDKAQTEIAKRRGDEPDEAEVEPAEASAQSVTPTSAGAPHDGRSAAQRHEDESVDPTAGPAGELPG